MSEATYLGMALSAKARAIWSDVYRQLGEIAQQTGCEAGARRAFHDGRFAALKELGLLGEDNAVASDETIRKRRLELDDALRERGTSRPDRDPIAFEPIVRRSTIVTMTEPESTESATEVAETANADVDAAEVEEVVESDDDA